jgi:histidinol dehydrogenase
MPLRLDARQPGFERDFSAFLALKRDAEADVDTVVAGIVADVRKRGGAALVEYKRRLDNVDLKNTGIRLSAGDKGAAAAR